MMGDPYLQWMLNNFLVSSSTRGMKNEQESKKVICNVLIDLKSCSTRRDLEWGRRIHAKAMETHHDLNKYVVTGLIRMYAKCGSMVDARCMFDSIQKPNVVAWNVLLLGYAENGDGLAALSLFSRMKAVSGCLPNSVTYIALLKACISLTMKHDEGECLKQGRKIHSEIGCHYGIFVQNTLIDMYAKCGSMVDARLVFEGIQNPDVVSWNVLLLGYAENGDGLTALDLFSRMKAVRGCKPTFVTYIAALKACTSLAANGDDSCLKQGRKIHTEIGCTTNHYMQNTLIDMYGKCGSMVDAQAVFDSIQNPDVVSWTALILGYVESGEGFTALENFSRMKACGCVPDSVTYVAALKSCLSLAENEDGSGMEDCLKQVSEIHSKIGRHLDHYVQCTLIDIYSKCGSMIDAHRTFDGIRKPDVVCWNALLLGYVGNGEGLVSLELFARMKASGCVPDSVSYIAALKACACLAVTSGGSGIAECLERGKELHSEIVEPSDRCLQTALIEMYARCGSMEDARRVFDCIQKPDVVCWNVFILGYASTREGFNALEMFWRMKASRCVPDSVTYVAVLNACSSLAANGDDSGIQDCFERGKQTHSLMGCYLDHHIQSTLIYMYTKSASMVDARNVFENILIPDVLSWNALLLGYVENGEGLTSYELFLRMKATAACAPNTLTYIAALQACGLIGDLVFGRKVHADVTEFTAQLVTCLVDFYAKCGSMVEAQEVFDMHSRGRVVPTWNALLAGYGKFGDTSSVFNLFEAMQKQGFQPDAVTFLCILSCCSHAGLIEKAREYFKAMLVQYRVTPSVMHYNCMVDLLGRANQLDEAIDVLRKMPCNPNAVTWMTLLAACRKWKNVDIGKWAFQSLLDIDEKTASACSSDMWQEQADIVRGLETSCL